MMITKGIDWLKDARWRLIILFLLASDRLVIRDRDLEERWFDRYVKQEIEAGKRPWFWKLRMYR